ncbi:MAG: DNA topoisomerase 3 [Pseudomonadota bacterium]
MPGHRLIVAEKPSVARDLARVLGLRGRNQGWIGDEHTRVTWCLGHLAELAEPSAYDPSWKRWSFDLLPMLPEAFQLQPRKEGRDQWRVVRDQLRERGLTEVVNACDAGREGELIFAHAYELAGCKAPVKRLWISSMTDRAIREGFQRLRDGAAMRALEHAARCRAEADWLVGLNATRAMTLRLAAGPGGALRSLGRVQTPTLAMLVDREDEIEAFVPQDFWQIKATFARGVPEGATWEALWTGPDPEGKPFDRFFARALAEAVLARVQGRDGVVTAVQRKESREQPPLLYDLTALQREANQRFGLTAERTLELCQALYERHKLLTYPRTDSRHLSEAEVPELPNVLLGLDFGPYAQAAALALQRDPHTLGPRFVDDAEVSDHHAIIPTGADPRQPSLTLDEKRIFDLVARRLLGAFHPEARFALATVEVHIDDDAFLAKGRTCVDPGWQAIDPPHSKRKEVLLPPVEEGEVAVTRAMELHQGQTRPPKRHNDASLLSAMERAGEGLEDAELKRAMKRNGLGTPATRAAILETLVQRGYVQRQERQLVPTPVGRALVAALPVPELRSPALTGAWEARLVAMSEGGESRPRFMEDVRAFATRAVALIREAGIDPAQQRVLVVQEATGEILGRCPRCGNPVREGRGGWSCGGCAVFVPARVAGREVSPRMAKRLLSTGATEVVKGFRSRAGKEFAAALKLDEEGSVKLHFPDPEPLGACPACGEPVRPRGKVYTCDTGRECAFVVFAEMSGRAIPAEAVAQLLREGRSAPLDGFTDRGGRGFSGALIWSGQRVEIRPFDPREAAEAAGPCPRCGGLVRFERGKWRCQAGDFSIPAEVAQRTLERDEVAQLLRERRTPRLHGFRQRSGAVFRAALALDDQLRVQLDYLRRPEDPPERPVPPGGPRPAFGAPLTCPCCTARAEREPGYVVAGREAWGCSRWRQGCPLRVPFEIEGSRLDEEQAQRLLGRQRATRYLSGLGGRQRQARVVLEPEAQPCWRVEERGAKG